jgi:hypothetical protein
MLLRSIIFTTIMGVNYNIIIVKVEKLNYHT